MPTLENPDQYKKAPVKALVKKATEVYKREHERCPLLSEAAAALEDLPAFEKTEIGLGRVVGRGGFCVVHDIQAIKLATSASGDGSGITTRHNNQNDNSSNRSMRWIHRSRTPSNTSTSNETAETEAMAHELPQPEEREEQQGGTSTAPEAHPQGAGGGGDASSAGAGAGAAPLLETPPPPPQLREPQTPQETTTTTTTSSATAYMNSREYLARRVWSKHKYVVKKVNRDLLQTDRVAFFKATIDLALEASILATLQHSNVVALRGVSSARPCTAGYFVILDKLSETLPKRLNAWMQTKRSTTGITGFFVGNRKKVANLMIDRLLVAHDIAQAMEYIHGRQLIFRDLKPDNVGFDAENAVKLFDFGLAKQLLDQDRGPDGLYQLTGLTGSIRYMAPEVGLCQAYNLTADVYSWGMIMWYILALEPPLCTYTPNMFHNRVFQQGYRPAVKPKWSSRLSDLMRACWAPNVDDRPSFHRIVQQVRAEATRLEPQLADFLAGDAASSKWSQKEKGYRRNQHLSLRPQEPQQQHGGSDAGDAAAPAVAN